MFLIYEYFNSGSLIFLKYHFFIKYVKNKDIDYDVNNA